MSQSKVNDAIDRRNKVASLRVSSRTNVGNLAGATWKYLQEGFRVDHIAIGAGAVNQSVKALATARDMASQRSVDLAVVPVFHSELIEGENRTAMRLHVVTSKKD